MKFTVRLKQVFIFGGGVANIVTQTISEAIKETFMNDGACLPLLTC